MSEEIESLEFDPENVAKNVMAIAQKAADYYMAVVEFLEAKNMKEEFDEWFLQRYMDKQNKKLN